MNGAHKSRSILLAAAFAVAAAGLFYTWTIRTARYGLDFRGPKQDYYNLLTQGFRKGHLYMDAEPDPSLLALAPDSRPGTAPFLLDASLYRGHYYLYFGAVPAMLLYLPYSALSGQGLPEAGAALIFASAGLFFATLWWLDVRRRFFPRSGTLWALVSILGIALGSGVPSTLRRPLFYEVAITAGYAFMMLALWAFTRARFSTGRRAPWLVLGALAAGLAVGSRANLGPSCVVIIVCGSVAAGTGRERGILSALVATGLAFGAVIAALGVYNAARFGNPLEFGHAYQLGVKPNRLFHLTNLEHNAGIYYLRPPALNGFFPFVAPAPEPIKPADYVGRESAHGEWIWLPLAVAAIWAWMWNRADRGKEGPTDGIWVVGLPAVMFLVNFIVTASVGVRANRYMLDFHPMLVLAVVSLLGMGLAARDWSARAGAFVAGAGVLAAAAFNVLGSMQAQGFFLATDPVAYSQIAAVADHLAWPFLKADGNPIGDRIVRLRWPIQAREGALEPIGASGTPRYDDVLWVEYGASRKARLVYQYSEYGRAYGSWFTMEPGEVSNIRISGAFLLPRPGHPWFGDRPIEQQEIVKRSLSVSVDGVTRLERDVPSHDSSPGLQAWGVWRHADGMEHSFSGAILKVGNEPVQYARVLESIAASGTVRVRLEFPPRCVGRYEPLLQSGTPAAFDTLVIHYIRPGFIQLVHDQLGSGARFSPEFEVDYSGEQRVEIDLPFAKDDVDWLEKGPVFGARNADRMRVTWNGRVVFEPEVPPVRASRAGIVLGANLLHSSVTQALFEGVLKQEASRKDLGNIGAGVLALLPVPSGAFGDERGILVRFDREDGRAAGLAWRRDASGSSVFLGWAEDGTTTWTSHPVGIGTASRVSIFVSKDGATIGGLSATANSGPLGRFVVEIGTATVLAQRTAFFSSGLVRADGSGDGEWSGTALLRPGGGAIAAPHAPAPPPALPGRIRFSFVMPGNGRISSSPILEAGRTGAADSIYLRGVADGRFVVGLDHWSVGTIESAPFELTAADVHTLGIEMASLDGEGMNPDGAVRISVDGRAVMDRRAALYPVRAGEVFFGANPLAMSTSAAVFQGDVVLVRTHQAAEVSIPGSR